MNKKKIVKIVLLVAVGGAIVSNVAIKTCVKVHAVKHNMTDNGYQIHKNPFKQLEFQKSLVDAREISREERAMEKAEREQYSEERESVEFFGEKNRNKERDVEVDGDFETVSVDDRVHEINLSEYKLTKEGSKAYEDERLAGKGIAYGYGVMFEYNFSERFKTVSHALKFEHKTVKDGKKSITYKVYIDINGEEYKRVKA